MKRRAYRTFAVQVLDFTITCKSMICQTPKPYLTSGSSRYKNYSTWIWNWMLCKTVNLKLKSSAHTHNAFDVIIRFQTKPEPFFELAKNLWPGIFKVIYCSSCFLIIVHWYIIIVVTGIDYPNLIIYRYAIVLWWILSFMLYSQLLAIISSNCFKKMVCYCDIIRR